MFSILSPRRFFEQITGPESSGSANTANMGPQIRVPSRITRLSRITTMPSCIKSRIEFLSVKNLKLMYVEPLYQVDRLPNVTHRNMF